MAIVKAKYIRSKPRIKAHLRYITHRRGAEGERLTRPLFGRDGALSKQQIYDMIDKARRGGDYSKDTGSFSSCSGLVKGLKGLFTPFTLGFAPHVECNSCLDLIVGTHTVDTFLHLTITPIASFHRIGRRGE